MPLFPFGPLQCNLNPCINGASASFSGFTWVRMETCSNPIANRFVNLVKADSDSKGDEFDVAYAIKIIELLFGDDGELRCRNSGEMNAEEFDDWLSGFNSEQP